MPPYAYGYVYNEREKKGGNGMTELTGIAAIIAALAALIKASADMIDAIRHLRASQKKQRT